MYFHETKEGEKIPLSQLTDSHLRNIIKWIERQAKEGIRISGGGWEEWDDEDVIYDDVAKEHLNYGKYVDELKKR